MKFVIVILLCGLSVQGLLAHPTESETETEDKHVEHAEESVTPSENQVCVPNEVKMEDCNRCKCAPNGVGWFCTRKECPPKVASEASAAEEEKPCVPGTEFQQDCNTCTCLETGPPHACTRKFCIKKPQPEETETVAKRSTQECEPETTWSDGCNTCHCSTTGLKACTKKFCVPLPKPEEDKPVAKRSPQECEPGTTWNDGCNTCHCTSNGHKACTEKACFGKRSPQECEPGTTWNDGCNTCHCTSNGHKACTEKACFGKRSTQECEPGTKWKEDCNSCSCTPTGFKACTLMRCFSLDNLNDIKDLQKVSEHALTKRSVPDVYADNYHCEPNQKFDHPDGCNKCDCDEHGKTKFCTRAFCQPRTKRSARTTGKCTPGQSFVADDGCNTCFCNTDGTTGGCTYKLCIERPRQIRSVENSNDPDSPHFECTPGIAFKHADGCNDCTCAPNGKVAACTLKLCVEKPKRDPYAPNFHCTPGKTFINPADGCNTCTCTDEGKTGACTQMACLETHHLAKRSPVSNDPASPDFACLPGATFKHADGCNTCTCSDNGKFAACTLMFCVNEAEHVAVVPAQQEEPLFTGSPYAEGFSCKPEASFKYECNDCRCLANGKVAMCTLKLCNPDNVRVARGITNNNNPKDPNFRCTAGDQFTHADGCNSCICSEDGRSASCTLRVCLSNTPETSNVMPETIGVVPADTKKCVPGSRFMSDDGCNTCFCTNDGKVGCTLMYCGNKPIAPVAGGSAPLSSRVDAPIQFPVEKRSRRNTDLTSLPHFDTSVKDFKCEPGLRFRDKCNACFCNDAGLAACTDALCGGWVEE